MKGLRDLFIGAKTLYAYRLNGGGTKAENTFATALCGGTRGNDLKIVIQENADKEANLTSLHILAQLRWTVKPLQKLQTRCE